MSMNPTIERAIPTLEQATPTPDLAIPTLDQALDVVEQLPADQQADLVHIMQRRLAGRGRERVIADVEEARADFAAGRCRVMTVEEIMREIQE